MSNRFVMYGGYTALELEEMVCKAEMEQIVNVKLTVRAQVITDLLCRIADLEAELDL